MFMLMFLLWSPVHISHSLWCTHSHWVLLLFHKSKFQNSFPALREKFELDASDLVIVIRFLVPRLGQRKYIDPIFPGYSLINLIFFFFSVCDTINGDLVTSPKRISVFWIPHRWDCPKATLAIYSRKQILMKYHCSHVRSNTNITFKH